MKWADVPNLAYRSGDVVASAKDDDALKPQMLVVLEASEPPVMTSALARALVGLVRSEIERRADGEESAA